MQANGPDGPVGGIGRRGFLVSAGAIAASLLLPGRTRALGAASQVDIKQIVYPGGNWQPRPTAVRRLSWEVHKRTAADTALDPGQVKPTAQDLSASPLAYLSGDRPFPDWSPEHQGGLSRFIRLGGTLIVDPAFTADGDSSGFAASVDTLLGRLLPSSSAVSLPPGHLIFRTFYSIARATGRVEGPPGLTGYEHDGRLAVIRTEHDLGGAWARDNLGNWEHEVIPGGERQRENAFRLGINLVMYALCLGYKDEEPHRRFGGPAGD